MTGRTGQSDQTRSVTTGQTVAVRIRQSRCHDRTRFTTWPDTLHPASDRSLESSISDRTRLVAHDRTRHRVRLHLPFVLLSWVCDRMHRSHEGPDAPVHDPLTRASACGLNWPDTPAALGHFDHSVRSLFLQWETHRFSASGAVENRCFTSTKSVESHLASSRGRERGTQAPLYRSNSTAFAKVLTPPSVYHHVHVC
jgi:hypothetical protein